MANGKDDWSGWLKTQGVKAPEKKLTQEVIINGDTTSVEVTPAQLFTNLNRKEKEAKQKQEKAEKKQEDKAKKDLELRYSKEMPDGTIIKAKSISDLKKESDAYNELTTPEKPEKVDESTKRDKWLKEMVKNQEVMDSQIETTDDEGKETYVDLLNDAQMGMFKNQQSALTDSVNYSLGREASKSPQNWRKFLDSSGLQVEADQKYEQFIGEIKMGKHGKIYAPNDIEAMATELTNQYIDKVLKEKYGIDK
tara:strand:+ start:444 stop:1196 length:753 start_codon:yes stop_codon:yes gene_type:complete